MAYLVWTVQASVWCLSKPQGKGNNLCFKQSSITTTVKEATCWHLSVCMLILCEYSLSISGTLGGVPQMRKGSFYCLRLPGILLFCLPSSFNSIFCLSLSPLHIMIYCDMNNEWNLYFLLPHCGLGGSLGIQYQVSTNPSPDQVRTAWVSCIYDWQIARNTPKAFCVFS